MTCLEKFRQKYPDVPLTRILNVYCPHVSGEMYDMPKPDYCPSENGTPECERCWNREIPGTENALVSVEEMKQKLAEYCQHTLNCVDCNLLGFDCAYQNDVFSIPEDQILKAHEAAFGESLEPDPQPTGTEPDPTPVIKDSGSRHEFESGAVRDIQQGKGRCDLMPLDVVCDVGEGWEKWQRDVLLLIHEFQQDGETIHLTNVLICFGMEVWPDPQTMLLEVSKHFEEGALKYGECNWQKGLPVKSFINSAIRHYLKWLRGDKDENHHLAFCWNLICAIWTCKHKPELNDYGLKTCACCDADIPKDEAECPNCRVTSQKTCIQCGAPIPEKWNYCDTCWENIHGGN